MHGLNFNVHTETPSVAVVVTTPSDTVNSGSTVLLVCVAYGSPESPSITWLFNGAAVTNSTSCQVSECVAALQGSCSFSHAAG